jgi:hypothetical protein
MSGQGAGISTNEALARLDVRVSAWTARGRDYFLLMTSLRVRDFRVNALISDRRGSNHALMLGWGSSTLLLIGCGWVFAGRSSKSHPRH